MPTAVLQLDSPQALRSGLELAAAILRQGGLVAFPTETVYGLGADARNPDAVSRIFQAKGRPASNPVIVHVADLAAARALATSWPDAADQLGQRFWPGPLALVVPRAEMVPPIVAAGGPTIALRVPAHPLALELLRTAGLPIAAPSANRSNRLSPTTAAHVLADLDGLVDCILDGGPCPGGIESTVVDVAALPPCLLRPGLLEASAIEAIVGPLLLGARSSEDPLPSPGMLARHYAPRTPLELASEDAPDRAQALHQQGLRVALLTWNAIALPGVLVVPMPADPVGYARMLYATLHDLDRQGLARIIVEPPPPGREWLAIRDRLRRAATPP